MCVTCLALVRLVTPPSGTSWSAGTLDWGWNVVGPPVLPPPTMSPTQSLTGWHFAHGWMTGQLQLTGWLAGWLAILQNVNWPSPCQRHLVAMCVTTLVRLTFGQMYLHSLGRDIFWQSAILLHLWVRLTFGQMYPPQQETSCGQVWHYFRSSWPVYLRVSGASSHSNSSSISIY